jgi:hypothetical protein
VAKPIRIGGVVQPNLHLSPEQFEDYERLEKRLNKLTPFEQRYYELLQRFACLHHDLQVKQMEKLLRTNPGARPQRGR